MSSASISLRWESCESCTTFSSSDHISIVSAPANFDSLGPKPPYQCRSRKGNWITTDSESIVVKFWVIGETTQFISRLEEVFSRSLLRREDFFVEKTSIEVFWSMLRKLLGKSSWRKLLNKSSESLPEVFSLSKEVCSILGLLNIIHNFIGDNYEVTNIDIIVEHNKITSNQIT
ncbi:hypothetical protein YC2023_082577 [Brassica napus]